MPQQLLTIQDDKIVINKLQLRYLEGTVTHAGQLHSTGPFTIQTTLTVEGTIIADTIKVKNLITDDKAASDGTTNWTYITEEDLNGKGLTWAWGEGGIQLMYRKGNRLWTNGNLDLEASKTYKINNIDVIGLTHLGPQISKSNLKEVGTLRSLSVAGDTVLGEFAVFNSTFNRLGLNTDMPNATLSIVDKNVEIIAGSPKDNIGAIGTFTSHDLELVTDNIPRVTVKKNGDVVIGNSVSSNANVTIHGTLNVSNIISDTRVERTYPIEFKATKDTSIYGQGMIWTGANRIRELVMHSDPDRLWTSESLDTAKEYYAEGEMVLSKTSLGPTVTNSNLTNVGKLQFLEATDYIRVDGETVAGSLRITDSVNTVAIVPEKIISNNKISININEDETYYADANEIILGNKLNSRRPVKVFGPVSVGTNNPDPTVNLTVQGPVSFDNKKFITGLSEPTTGSYNKGDVCWNQDPKESSYVGWICVSSGTPGLWLPFGAIGRR